MKSLIDFRQHWRLICSLVIPFVASALQYLFWDFIKPFAFVLFYPAVFVSCWIGGLVGGISATIISVALIVWFFLEPFHSLAISDPIHFVALGIFAVVGCLTALTHERLRRKHAEWIRTQQHLQQSLQENGLMESRFKAVFDESPLGMALVDSNSGQLYEVNQAFADIVGRTFDQLSSVDWMQITHPDDIQADLANMQRFNAGEINGFQMNKRYLRPDNSIVWISLTVARLQIRSYESPRHLCLIENITARLEAENQLAEAKALAAKFQSEQRYAAMVAQDIVGIAEADQFGTLTLVNDRYCSITGYTREQLIGKNLLEITHPEDRYGNQVLLEQIASTGQSAVIEKRYLRPNGDTVWTFNTVSILYDELGHPSTFTAMVLDISERKQKEHQLRQTMELLQLAECSASSGVWRWDISTGEITWSDQLFRLFGLSSGSSTASFDTWEHVLHPDDRELANQRIQDAINTHQPLVSTYRILLSDGSIRWIDSYGNAYYDDEGVPLRFAGLCIDVTLREKSAMLLRESEQRFRELFENLPICYQSLDIEGRWLDANKKLADLLGFDSPQEMLGLDFVDYWHEDFNDRFDAAYDQFKATHSIEGEIQLYRRDGKLIDVMVTGRIQRDIEGKFMRTHCVLIDISERRTLERSMRDLNAILEQEVNQRTEALRISENRSRQILAGHPIAVLLADEQGIIRDANPKACQLIRCKAEELIGSSVDELIPPAQRLGHALHRANFAKYPEHRQMSVNREVILLARDGTEVPVEIGLGPIMLEGSLHVIAALNDISLRKQADAALKESQTTLERAQRVAKIGSWKLGGSTDEFVISEEVRRIYAFDSNTVTYDDWFTRILPEDHAAVESAWHATLQCGAPFEITFRIVVEGQLKWIKALAELTFDAYQNVISAIGTVQDISSLKTVELKVQEAMQYLKLATKVSGIGIWSWNLIDDQIEWDDRMYELYGVDRHDLGIDYATWLSLVHPDDRLQTETVLKFALKNEGSFNNKFRISLPSGLVRHIQPYSVFEYSASGQPVRMIGINQDISRTIEQQEILEAAKKAAESANESKSNFLANMSHEIRTPMNAIIGLTTIVKETELSRQQRDYLDKVQAASRSLLSLINDILDYSKIEAGYMEFENVPFQLEDTIRNSTMLFAFTLKEKGLILKTELSPDLPIYVVGDSIRLEQVLNNLIGNAVKFTEQGEIGLKVEPVPLPGNDHNVATIRFSISDTGIGIEPDILGKLFSPFRIWPQITSRHSPW